MNFKKTVLLLTLALLMPVTAFPVCSVESDVVIDSVSFEGKKNDGFLIFNPF